MEFYKASNYTDATFHLKIFCVRGRATDKRIVIVAPFQYFLQVYARALPQAKVEDIRKTQKAS
jgi:hypothetical protein